MKKFSIFVLLVAAAFVFFPKPAEASHLIKGAYISPSSGSYGDSRTLILSLDKDTDSCKVTRVYEYVSASGQNTNTAISVSQSGQNKRGELNLGSLFETTSYTIDCVDTHSFWWDHHAETTVVAKVNPTVIVSANSSFGSLQMEGTESLNIGWSASANARSCKLTSPYSENGLARFGSLATIQPDNSYYPQPGADGSRIFIFECTESPGGEAQPPGGWGTGSNGVYVFLGAAKPTINMYVNGVSGDTSISPSDNLTVSWDVDGNGWGIYYCAYPVPQEWPDYYANFFHSLPWPTSYSDSVTYAPGDSLHPTPDGENYRLSCTTSAGTTVVNRTVSIKSEPDPPPTVSLEVKKSGTPDSTYSGGPLSINSGEQVTLKWAVTGKQVVSCNWTSGLTGSASVSGGTTNASPASDIDYSLRCTNPFGTGDSNVVSVDVIAKQCNDGIDNDSDGFIDHPNDPGCSSATDDDEYNAPPPEPDAVLRVQSSGANGVTITRISGTAGIGGTTAPNFYTRTSKSSISGVIEAPASAGGNNFQSWSDCTSSDGRQCSVSVDPGSAQTVTATYQTPTYAVVYVRSTGVTGMDISVSSGDENLAGQIPYDRLSESTLSGTLEAPSSFGNWNFANWSGCDSSAGRFCTVTTDPGDSQTPTAHYSAPPSTKQCNDGADNDGDSLIDYPADPGCSSADDNDESNGRPPPPPPPAAPACSDGIDNDDDGLMDWPADVGCSSPDDDDETFRFLRRIFREL